MLRVFTAIVAALTMVGLPAQAQQPKAPGKSVQKEKPEVNLRTLKLGDPAPPLHVAKWVKGEPVAAFEPGKVYLLQFWTTWCVPCHEVFPVFTDLQKQYPELTVIGVSFTDPRGESIDKVIPFVESAGDKMGYRVAFDDDRKTVIAFLDGSGIKEIPVAYIINQNGRVVWMGHPLDKMEEAVAQVLAGKYDLNAAIIAARRKAEMLERAKPYETKLNEAFQKGDSRTALILVDQLVAMDPQVFGKYAALKFTHLLTKMKDYPEAYKYTQWLLSGPFKDNPQALNRMAWTILDDPAIEKRDYDLALRLSKRANEIEKAKDPDVMDTLARAYYEKGDIDKAIEWQTRAMEVVATAERKAAMQQSLEKYQTKKTEKLNAPAAPATPPGGG